ncbi:MAG: helix-turn-helix domain-containing protein [Bryobacteraceae bacterium]
MEIKANSKTISTIFVGKWTVNVLFCLQQGPRRHTELRRRLEGVSQRMLTKTLRNLESTGLIGRREIKSKVMGVEYSLTELGKAFIRPLDSMCRWARQHNKQVSADVHLAESMKG